MIDGCLDGNERAWRRACVRTATEGYLAAEDGVADLDQERCTVDRGAWEGAGPLMDSWRAWADGSGEDGKSQKWFNQALDERGFASQRDGTKADRRGYRGIRLNPVADYTEDRRYGS